MRVAAEGIHAGQPADVQPGGRGEIAAGIGTPEITPHGAGNILRPSPATRVTPYDLGKVLSRSFSGWISRCFFHSYNALFSLESGWQFAIKSRNENDEIGTREHPLGHRQNPARKA